jgi:hypothetical protein
MAVVLAAVLVTAPLMPITNAVAWFAIWGLPLLVAIGGAMLLHNRDTTRSSSKELAASLAIIAICATLIEFPFSTMIYMVFALPLTLLALLSFVRSMGKTSPAAQWVMAGFLLVFGLTRPVPLLPDFFGFNLTHATTPELLDLPRGGLWVQPNDARLYNAMIPFVQHQLSAGRLWAGPDSPEIYFLSGAKNHTRTLFDLLDTSPSAELSLSDRVLRVAPSLVVLNL